MKSNLAMIEDINKQRDSNKILKVKVQSDIGELRRMYQVTGYKAEQPESVDTSPSGDFPRDLRQAQSEELTMQLYRNRQRLMALRSAVQELESKPSSVLLPSCAPSSSVPALPPIEASSILQDDVKPSSVFMTARAPLEITVHSISDPGSRTVVEVGENRDEIEKDEERDEVEAKVDKVEVETEEDRNKVEEEKEEEEKEEEEGRDELHASLDDIMPTKLRDFSTDLHGEEVNRRPSIHLASDL